MVIAYQFNWDPKKLQRTTLSIVDILSGDQRALVHYPKKHPLILPYEMFAINFTYRDGSRPYRGMQSFGAGPEKLYMIDAERKVLAVSRVNQDLFTASHDKIPDENKYVVKDQFEKVLADFSRAGYRFIDLAP